MYHPQTFSQWFVKAYPLTPFVCFILYAIALLVIVVIGLVRWLVKGNNKKWYIEATEFLLIIIHGLVILIETYKNFMEYIETTEHKEKFCDAFATGLDVFLVKADWCSACKMFLHNKKWEDIQTQLTKEVSGSFVNFKSYDISSDEISSVLKIDVKSIPYVPCIYIRTPEGFFMYKDNIYNTSDVVSVVKALIKKFIFSGSD